MTYTNEQIADAYIDRLSGKWQVINQTDKGIQIKRTRKFSRLGFWIGLLLLPFWGIGIIFWTLALFDYIIQGDKVKFVTLNQMTCQLKGK